MSNKSFGANRFQPIGLGFSRFQRQANSPVQNPPKGLSVMPTKMHINGVEYVRNDRPDSGQYRSEKNSLVRNQLIANGQCHNYGFKDTNSARGAAVSTGPKNFREREGAFSIDSQKNYSEGNRSESRPFKN